MTALIGVPAARRPLTHPDRVERPAALGASTLLDLSEAAALAAEIGRAHV
jgi:hypothetical protein